LTFEAAVFDLFGTLVPEFSRSDFYDAVRQMAEILGVDPVRFEQEWNATALERQTGGFATVEDNVLSICSKLGVDPTDGAVGRALDVRSGLYRKWFHPRVGALETLAELRARGYPIALISMCAPDAPAMWRASPLSPLVDVEVFSSEVGLRKPDAAIYRYASDELGVDPKVCLYCGDGAYGELSGAEAVGMTAYLLADPSVDPGESLTPEREEWDGPKVSDLRELLAFFSGRS
jgi:putative hydrolase of the HAD superfamily